MKKYIMILLLTVINIDIWSQEQRISVSTAYLIQNSPFKEFATLQLSQYWYAQQYDFWNVDNTGMGVAFGFAYDVKIHRSLFFRLNTQLETSGWIAWVIDVGLGIRMPIKKGHNFIIDVSFATQQTGGKLSFVGIPPTTISLPAELDMYMGLFGFKGRIAYEFEFGKNFFISTYFSYAAYPWIVSTLIADIYINGVNTGKFIDSLQIGIEFGKKF